MSKSWRSSLLLVVLFACLVPSEFASGQAEDLFDAKPDEKLKDAVGWQAFTRGDILLDFAVVLIVAVVLSALIAYHPLTRRKASSIQEIEQPKTFLMYSLVAAVIALVVRVNPDMAFVVFGIGGLMRFRTDVGEPKDTGRVILVTAVGLSCGIQMYVLAVLTTVFGWAIIFYLERQQAGRLLVKGLDREVMPQAEEAYSKILTGASCSIIGSKKNVVKGQVSIVFKAPSKLDRDTIEGQFVDLPENIRGAVDWDIS